MLASSEGGGGGGSTGGPPERLVWTNPLQHRGCDESPRSDGSADLGLRAVFEAIDTDLQGTVDLGKIELALELADVNLQEAAKPLLEDIRQEGGQGEGGAQEPIELDAATFCRFMCQYPAVSGQLLAAVDTLGADLRKAQSKQAGLVLECEEDETELAEAIGEGEDLFEVLHKGTTMADSSDADFDTDQDDALRVIGLIDKNHDEVIEASELRAVVEKSLGAAVTDVMLRDLMKQIDTNDTGAVTVAQFRAWYDQKLADGGGDRLRDNMDPQALAMQRMLQGRMISPNSIFRKRWDIFQVLLLIYVGVSVPYRVAFDDSVQLWSFMFFVDFAVDCYFWVDLVLNFRTAIITKDGEVIYEQKDVAKAYMTSWFVVDFTSCLPFAYIEFIFWDDSSDTTRSTRAVRLFRLFRLLKLLRLVRMKRILDRWEEELYSVGLVKLAKLLALILISSHWLCCGWFAVGLTEECLSSDPTGLFADDCDDPDANISYVGWVVQKRPDWQTEDKSTLYLDAAFFASMASLMVSTEDPHMYPSLLGEKFMFAGSFLVGAVVMSLIIGNMSDIIAHANPGQTATKEALGKVHAFLHDRHVPSMLSRRIRAHFSVYYAERGTTEDMTEIFKILPTDMQVELATALRFVSDEKVGLKGVFSKVPFFCNLQPSDLIKIGVKMRHQQCFQVSSAGSEEQPVANFIMKEGDRTSEMWIVVDGSVHVERSGSDQSAVRIGKLRVNDIFGELAVLIQEAPGLPFPRLRSAHAASSSVLLLSLTFQNVQELRAMSKTIDVAVRRAIAVVQRNRPALFAQHVERHQSLFSPRAGDQWGVNPFGATGSFQALEAKVGALAGDIADIAGDMADIKRLLQKTQ